MINILVLAYIVPIEGLKRENDVILKYVSLLKEEANVTLVKGVQYYPPPISFFNSKAKLRNVISTQSTIFNDEFDITINLFPWIMFGNSIKLKSILAPINYHLFSNRIKNVIKEKPINLIHAHSFDPDGYIAYRLFLEYGYKYVFTLRCRIEDTIQDHSLRLQIVKNASLILTHNYSLYEKYKESFEILFLPHGIDATWFEDVRDKPTREQLKLRILTVGRFLELKHITSNLRAIKFLIDNNIKVKYTLVGEGPEHKNILSEIDRLNISDVVNVLPWQDRSYLKKLYDEHDVFLLVSYPETFGRVYLEAAARKLPIIASVFGGIRGFFTEDDAFFIEKDPLIIFKLLYELADYGSAMSESARVKVKNAYKKVSSISWDSIIKTNVELYNNIQRNDSEDVFI